LTKFFAVRSLCIFRVKKLDIKYKLLWLLKLFGLCWMHVIVIQFLHNVSFEDEVVSKTFFLDWFIVKIIDSFSKIFIAWIFDLNENRWYNQAKSNALYVNNICFLFLILSSISIWPNSWYQRPNHFLHFKHFFESFVNSLVKERFFVLELMLELRYK